METFTQKELAATSFEEKIAYEILCKVLDKLNSDIRELTNRLKMSLDRLDTLEAARGINDKNY